MGSRDISRPNIVYIMADDLGYGDVGCYNPASRIPTPNIDRLAAEGLRLTDAHSPSAVCTPTRYGVMTGRYCWRSPLRSRVLFNFERPLIEKDRPTLPGLLARAGYHTAAIGKWHLGWGYSVKPGRTFDFDRPLPWPFATRAEQESIDFTKRLWGGPLELGFASFFGTAASSTHQPPYGFIEGDRFVDPPSVWWQHPKDGQPGTAKAGMASPGWDPGQVDLTFAAKAEAYIRKRAQVDAPFFLYLSSSAVHEPCIEEVVPPFARGRSEAGPRGDLAWLFDWVVGQVVAALAETGQDQNTILIVTSDNGALPGDRMLEDGREVYHLHGHKSCGDWRGYKAHIWEGGHREPLIVRWPGHVAAGSRIGALFCLTDVMPTLAGLLGLPLPPGAAPDGLDQSPVLLASAPDPSDPSDPIRSSIVHHSGMGAAQAGPIRSSIVHHSGMGAFSVRSGSWKAIFDTRGSGGWPPPAGAPLVAGSPGQLYNLAGDPGETQNLWEAHPEIVTQLAALLVHVQSAQV